jgi:hypothetical protein
MASESGLNRNEQKRIQKQSDTMISSFQVASEEAFEMTIKDIIEALRLNQPLAHTLHGMIKHNTLVKLLDGSLRPTASSQAGNGVKDERKKMRACSKKWKHLKEQPDVCKAILKVLEPTKFGIQ